MAAAFAECADEPAMRSVRAIIRLTDEQLALREDFIRLRDRTLALVFALGAASLLFGIVSVAARVLRFGVVELFVATTLLVTAVRNYRAIARMEREQNAIEDAAAIALAFIVPRVDLLPLDRDERRIVRRLVRGRPAFQTAALRLLFEPDVFFGAPSGYPSGSREG
jgi:hypothetical protein